MRTIICIFIIAALFSCHRPAFKEKWVKQTAPENFSARFETSRGFFEVSFTREWSPLAVDRIFAQLKHGYYDHTLFYRVKAGYVAQFGGDDSVQMKAWARYKVPDEPVLKPNERGTISFARSGKETRDNDLFINLQNNSPRLDTIAFHGVKGFPVVGLVTRGMDVVDSLYNGYGDTVFEKYDLLFQDKKAFTDKFPKLDSIKRVKLFPKRNQ